MIEKERLLNNIISAMLEAETTRQALMRAVYIWEQGNKGPNSRGAVEEARAKVIEAQKRLISCQVDLMHRETDFNTISMVLHDPDILPPVHEPKKGGWIDLRAAEDVELKQGDYRVISLGISMKLPEGYEAIIAPRSSTYKTWGIICANSVGIIDNSYCGTNDVWGFPAIAMRDTVIHKNDRICQFRLVPTQELTVFQRKTELENKDRGGFGSTGRN